MFTSIKDQSLKKPAAVMWSCFLCLVVVYALNSLRQEPQRRRLNPGKSIQAEPSTTAGGSTTAQFSPRSESGPVLLAESGYTGLYYFRDYYVGTQCTIEDGLIACMVQGDYHASDVYFPDPHMVWL